MRTPIKQSSIRTRFKNLDWPRACGALAVRITLAILGSIAFPSLAQAGICGLTIAASGVTFSWSQNLRFQAVTATITKSDGGRCDFGVTFTAGGATSYSSRRLLKGTAMLPYQLYQDSALNNVLKDVPDLSSSTDYYSLSLRGGRGDSVQITYYVALPVSASAPLPSAGSYSDTFQIRAYEGRSIAEFTQVDASASVPITVVVPKQIDLSLVSAGSAFNSASTHQSLTFGALEAGKQMGFDLLVRSNAGFQVTFSSLNQGVLKTAASTTSYVPYQMKVNGASRDLGSSAGQPVIVASGSGSTGMDGSRNTVGVTVGSTDTALAGQYTDTIVVTATTRE